MKKREKLVAELLTRAKARGEIGSARDPAALATVIVVFLQGLATSARGGVPLARLRGLVDEVLELVAGPRARAPKKR